MQAAWFGTGCIRFGMSTSRSTSAAGPRLDDERLAVGIFDRARDKVIAACRGSLMLPRHRGLLREVLDVYDFGLL